MAEDKASTIEVVDAEVVEVPRQAVGDKPITAILATLGTLAIIAIRELGPCISKMVALNPANKGDVDKISGLARQSRYRGGRNERG